MGTVYWKTITEEDGRHQSQHNKALGQRQPQWQGLCEVSQAHLQKKGKGTSVKYVSVVAVVTMTTMGMGC